VPIVTRQSTSSDVQQQGSSGLIQEIQYRRTGVLLTISPVVHSGNRIDLEITQEVSESKPAPAGGVNSPSIFTRKIQTSLNLKDGGSVLLGGLISASGSKGYTGVPYLSEIPVVGRAFKVESESETRTELIMLLVPYVIESSRDAEAVTEEFRKRLTSMETADEDRRGSR
jgi:general secretion pathway protein D